MRTNHDKSDFEIRTARAYNRDFTPAVLGYVAACTALLFLVDFDTAGWWKYLAVLIPVIPALWGVRAVARHLDRIDELARDNLLQGMSFGFGLAMIAALTLGMVGMTGLDSSRWGPWVIYSAGMAGWVLAGVRLQSRL